jgi:hypothetical protein
MNIIFTICSNNYLAQAKTLGDSLIAHNPDYTFIIGLVDEIESGIDYHFFDPYLIIPVSEIGISDFDSLWKKYSIVEFNTSVKASYFKFIFQTYPEVNTICYFDPDIMVYHSLKVLEDAFVENDLLLTPHILSPIDLDDKQPNENNFLNFGLYNLGFLGVHRDCTAPGSFLDWWEKRILNFGFHDVQNGIFVDQLWINYVPLFYKRVKILRNTGLNVAAWNLHERTINEKDNSEMADGSPLYFYHFSNYKFSNPEEMSVYYTRYNFDSHPEVKQLYKNYRQCLISNKIEHFSQITCKYVEYRNQYLQSKVLVPSAREKLLQNAKTAIKQLIPPVLLDIKNSMK